MQTRLKTFFLSSDFEREGAVFESNLNASTLERRLSKVEPYVIFLIQLAINLRDLGMEQLDGVPDLPSDLSHGLKKVI